VSWLAASLVLSIVLTVVLNLALRLFPGAGRRLGSSLERMAESRPDEPDEPEDRGRVRVVFPWRTMLLVSVVGTVVLNLVLLLRR
jgi:hypothetical protein